MEDERLEAADIVTGAPIGIVGETSASGEVDRETDEADAAIRTHTAARKHTHLLSRRMR